MRTRLRPGRLARRTRNSRLPQFLEQLEDRLVLSNYTVTDLSDGAGAANDMTLRYAINLAVTNQDPAATIGFALASPGSNPTITYNAGDASANTTYGPTALVISGSGVNITIDGSGAPGLTIDGSGAIRLFAVTSTASLTLQDVTLTGGLAKGGNGGDGAGGGGGGAGLGGAVFNQGTLNLVSSTLSGNTATGGNGGQYIPGVGGGGGGGGLGGNGVAGSANGQNYYEGNGGGPNGGLGGGEPGNGSSFGQSGGFGGGGGGSLLEAGNGGFGGGGGGGGTVAGQSGDTGNGGFGGGGGGGGGLGGHGYYYGEGKGGGVLVQLGGSGAYYSSTRGGGGGIGGGGGVFNDAGAVTITDSTLTGNNAYGGIKGGTASSQGAQNGQGLGGALFNLGGTVTVDSSTLDNNEAGQAGGGTFVLSGSVTLTDCTVSGNTAQDGGGMANTGAGALTLMGTTVSGNTAQYGGDIETAYGGANPLDGVTLTNCTLYGNTAQRGGGIYISTAATLINCSVTANRSDDDSGGGLDAGPFAGGFFLYNTIIAGNYQGAATLPGDINGGSNRAFGQYSLVGNAGTAGGLSDGVDGNIVGMNGLGLIPIGDIFVIDSSSGMPALADNGGPTETVALAANSPAIEMGSVALAVDANGNPLTTDQRGETRIVNSTVDIGAYEAQHSTTMTTVIASPITSVFNQSVTLTATVMPQSGSAIPAGSVQFEDVYATDITDLGNPVTIDDTGVASLTLNTLPVGSPSIAAVFTGDSPVDFGPSTGNTSSLNIEPATVSNIDYVVNNAPSSSDGSVALQTASSTAVNTALQAVDNANPASPVMVTLDLDGASTTPTTEFSAPSSVQVDVTSSSGNATVQGAMVTSGTVIVAASVAPVDWTVYGGNVTVEGSAGVGDFTVYGGTVTLANGTVISGGSPAITLNGGTVILQGVTAQTTTNSPTIVVNGGSLLVRNSTIQESTGYAQAAILITGGTVDLGTAASTGGNTFNVNGTGTLIENTTNSPVTAVSDTFENNSAVVASNFGVVSLSTPPAQTANMAITQSFSLGSLTDTVRDSQSWSVDVNWGDNSAHTDFNATSTGLLSAQPHAFATPGTYTVTVTVTDPVGGGSVAWDFVQSFTVTVSPSIIVLDPSAGGALSLSGNASVKITGAVVVDSSSSSAISASGNAGIKASLIDVHGGVQKSGNASFSPAATTGAKIVSDPLAGLTALAYSGTPVSETLSGNSTATINPGVYSQITVSGNASLTLNPGIYVIAGGGLSVSGNAGVTGTKVMIYNTKSTTGTYGSVTLSGNGAISLTAPTTGTYAGILIFQDRANAKALTFSGNAMQGSTGTIYAPAAQLAESGNAQIGSTSNPVSLIVDTLTISGNGVANTVTLNSPTGTVAYSPNQIRDAYGINNLSLDGTGQTMAIVDAYDDPSIFQSLDDFDSQFSLTDAGPTLYSQYGPASSFLTVLNQYGQATSLPSTDPNGPGTDNWEVEEALDVEWAHAIAPGAQIILV